MPRLVLRACSISAVIVRLVRTTQSSRAQIAPPVRLPSVPDDWFPHARDDDTARIAKSPSWRRIAAKALGQIRFNLHRRQQRLPYIVTAIRDDEKMQSVRNSALIALAKARVWESEGWRVSIADPDGQEHAVAQLDALTAFRPEKLKALTKMLPAEEASRGARTRIMPQLDLADAWPPEDMHGPWLAEPYGPWPAHSRSAAAEKVLMPASS
jgi:hypothetical protein